MLGTLNIGVFFALLFFAAYRLPGGVVATLGAVQPLVVAGLSVALLGERLRVRTVVAGLVAVAGVALLVLRAAVGIDGAGVVAGVAATAAMALGVVLTKRWGRPVPLLTFTGWQLAAGGILLAPLTLAAEGPPAGLSAVNLAGFAYLALVNTAIGYALWFRGLERLPAAHVSFLGLLSPVVAASAGWLVLGQDLNGLQLLGMALALGSLVAAQRAPVRRDIAAPRAAAATSAHSAVVTRVPAPPGSYGPGRMAVGVIASTGKASASTSTSASLTRRRSPRVSVPTTPIDPTTVRKAVRRSAGSVISSASPEISAPGSRTSTWGSATALRNQCASRP